MSEVFLKILNMSISAGWLVLMVLISRLVLKKAPKWTHVLLSCIGVAACFLTNPIKENSDNQKEKQSKQSGKEDGGVTIIDDASFYLERASIGKVFRNMDVEQSTEILKEQMR